MAGSQPAAVHEAGHCVTGVSLGLTPAFVSLRDGGGLTSWRWDGRPSLHKRLMILAAGQLAETLHGFTHREWASSDDDSQAVTAIGTSRRASDNSVGDPWSAPEGRAAHAEARAILISRRAQVAALAEQLMIYRHLSSVEVVRFLASLPRSVASRATTADYSLSLARRRLTLDAAEPREVTA